MRKVVIALVAIIAALPAAASAGDGWGHHDCPGSVDSDFNDGRSTFGVSASASNDDSSASSDVVVDSRGGVSVSVTLGTGAAPPNSFGRDEAARTSCDSTRRRARGLVN